MIKEFSQEQVEKIKEWLDDGYSISKLQDSISSEFQKQLTYMETRFLIDDLNLSIKSEKPNLAQKEEAKVDELSEGKVSVAVNDVAIPGTMLNGSVVFSDGEQGTWKLDELGRISLISDTHGYKPSAEDLKEFQKAIQEKLSGV